MFILQSKEHNLPFVILMIFVIMLFGFKTVFISDYTTIKGDGLEASFAQGEDVELLKESKNAYIIAKEDLSYQVPRNSLVRTTRSSQTYKVIDNTPILDKPNGNILRKLQENELLIPEKIEGEYGIFLTNDKISGYVKLEAVQVETVDSGISRVDKVIKNTSTYYVLAKGEPVIIKNFKEGNYTIIDDKDNEFQVDIAYLELRNAKEQVSRGSVSRRTQSLSKVVTSAYKALGSPYIYGQTGAKGYDCSGLTYSIYLKDLNIALPRSSYDQVNAGIEVKKDDLVPGDILFFNTTGNKISHVGLYIGDGNMIHASSGSTRKVIISTINSGYYKDRYVTARRIIH